MTVIPFRPRPRTGTWPQFATETAVTGSFDSPTGHLGTFTGHYRLERCIAQSSQLTTVGVFSGALIDADGNRIGLGARRQTSPVRAVASGNTLLVMIGPLNVNLLGFRVTVNQVSVDI